VLFRILLVEDHDAVRRFIRSMLEQRTDFQIVGEAVDGAEAVEKARELKPDIIVLDVGLPKLNGLEAASEIRSTSPDTKILFLSLECFPDVVKEAFRRGAQGYVHKLRAQADLLPAMDAVLGGRQFVGNDISFSTKDSYSRHEVQFYSGDSDFLEGVAGFLGDAMKRGNPVIVLATKSHSEILIQRLKHDGIDIDNAVRSGTYISLDANSTLSRIMVNGRPDVDGFADALTGLVESAALAATAESPRVSIFGECVGLLCAEGNVEAAIQLEKTGNEMIKNRNVDILCAYPLIAFSPFEDARAMTRICAEHTAVHSHR
jgi:DNA-binding NarL/FixJ family response regulator